MPLPQRKNRARLESGRVLKVVHSGVTFGAASRKNMDFSVRVLLSPETVAVNWLSFERGELTENFCWEGPGPRLVDDE